MVVHRSPSVCSRGPSRTTATRHLLCSTHSIAPPKSSTSAWPLAQWFRSFMSIFFFSPGNTLGFFLALPAYLSVRFNSFSFSVLSKPLFFLTHSAHPDSPYSPFPPKALCLLTFQDALRPLPVPRLFLPPAGTAGPTLQFPLPVWLLRDSPEYIFSPSPLFHCPARGVAQLMVFLPQWDSREIGLFPFSPVFLLLVFLYVVDCRVGLPAPLACHSLFSLPLSIPPSFHH